MNEYFSYKIEQFGWTAVALFGIVEILWHILF